MSVQWWGKVWVHKMILYRIVGENRDFEENPLRKQLIFILYFPESPLISSKLGLNLAASVTAVTTLILSS
jgi:hypothetical protein